MLEVLTPDSPRWDEFAAKLEDRLTIRGDCDHSLRLAKQAMASMRGVDVEGSLTYFRKHGGYCDCEILMNVDPKFRGDEVTSEADGPARLN